MSENSKPKRQVQKYSYDNELNESLSILREELHKSNIVEIIPELVVYNINPQLKWLRYFGIGIHHTAIKIGECEIAFGQHPEKETGVYLSKFKHSIPEPATVLYTRPLQKISVDKLIQGILDMSKQWLGYDYNMTQKNCNHYTEALIRNLYGRKLPLRYNNAARVYEAYLRCKRFFGCQKRPYLPEEEEQLVRSVKQAVTRNQIENVQRKYLFESSDDANAPLLS